MILDVCTNDCVCVCLCMCIYTQVLSGMTYLVHHLYQLPNSTCTSLAYRILLLTDESSVAGLQQKRLNARDFDVIRVIGRGAFGEVQLVSDVLLCLSQCGHHWDYTNVSSSLERCPDFRAC